MSDIKHNHNYAHHHSHENCECHSYEHHDHDINIGCACGCGHDHVHSGKEDYKKIFIQLGIGAVLFVLGILLAKSFSMVALICLVAAYLILGGEVLFHAAKNIVKGHIFDENFLMSLATLAAFAIGEYVEAVAVMLFFQVGELCQEIAVARSRSRIMEAVDMRPEVVSLLASGEVQVIPAKEAKIGDVLLVKIGDRIPLDGVVLKGESQVDTAPVTGESVPVTVTEGSHVISGCINVSGSIEVRVDKELEESMVTRILHSVENAVESKPKMDRFITRFSKVYTPFVVVLALGTAIIPSLFSGEWEFWIYTAITFLVISCPCALVLSVPLAFFSGIGAGSKKGILFKGGLALEMLQKVKAVALDKTGTITTGSVVDKTVVNDTIKPEAKRAIARLKRNGLRVAMLTGDKREVAEEIANETGVELCYAQLLPDEKFDRMQEIRAQYGSIMFVGDGINDAPVLAGADVGAAMGSGADAAIEAADVVFMTSSMDAVPEAIEIAKGTNRIAMQNVVFALSVKALVMILGLCGLANMWMAVFADTGVAMLCVLNSVRMIFPTIRL